jgi:hypothetical protein
MKHLNHGSFGAVPLVAQERQNELRAEMDSAPVVWFPALPQKIADARVDLAAFLRATPDDLALVPNASAGISVVLNALPRRRGGAIVVTDHGYGAVTMGAERLARRWGGEVRTARVPLDADEEQAYEAVVAEVDDATDLIVVDQITSATARRMPVERIGAEAARLGIPLLVDGAHAPGLIAAPLDGADVRLLGRQPAQVGLCATRHRRTGRPRRAARGPLSADRLVGRPRSVSRPLRPAGHGGRHRLSRRVDGPGLRRPHLGLGHRTPVHGRPGRLRRAPRRSRLRRTGRGPRHRRRGPARFRHAARPAARGAGRKPDRGGRTARPGRPGTGRGPPRSPASTASATSGCRRTSTTRPPTTRTSPNAACPSWPAWARDPGHQPPP